MGIINSPKVPSQLLAPKGSKLHKKLSQVAIVDWGIDLLKLDFLYAPYFNPNHSSHHVPAKQIKWLLSYVKKQYPKVQTIACGAPFQESSSLVDMIRVSKDTALPPYVPSIINRVIYNDRIKLLKETLKSELPPLLNLDPDVRMFHLDSPQTRNFWDTIQTPVVGTGDNLLELSNKNINSIQVWLKNLSSQS
jgi:hypothetical protein